MVLLHKIHFSRCLIPQALMWTLIVIVRKVASNACASIFWCVIWTKIDIFVFNRSSKPFNKYVIKCSSAMIHADLRTSVQEQLGVFGACEVAALITIFTILGTVRVKAFWHVSSTKPISSVSSIIQATTYREYQSKIAVK